MATRFADMTYYELATIEIALDTLIGTASQARHLKDEVALERQTRESAGLFNGPEAPSPTPYKPVPTYHSTVVNDRWDAEERGR